MQLFRKFLINKNNTIRDALKKMSANKEAFCIFIDKNIVQGIFTEGDFRKSVYLQTSLDEKIEPFINKNFKFVLKNYKKYEVKNIFRNSVVNIIPVLSKGKLQKIIFKNKFFKKNQKKISKNINVIIMAGGLGKRLDPFTRILPKPLIPLGNDPVIKVIMDKFYSYGIRDYIISLGHKSNMIKYFFSDYVKKYKIKYFKERKPLGTIGALGLMKKYLSKDFFLVNCDTVINADFEEMLVFHKKNKNKLTLVGAVQNHQLPFGVCSCDNNGKLISFKEKPSFDYVVNTGLYIINREILKFIPKNKKLDLTELIDLLMKKNFAIGVYPISENSWMDVGQPDNYEKTLSKLIS